MLVRKCAASTIGSGTKLDRKSRLLSGVGVTLEKISMVPRIIAKVDNSGGASLTASWLISETTGFAANCFISETSMTRMATTSGRT
ncbi:hypothetical protein D3C86_1437280 [compost metagenome]